MQTTNAHTHTNTDTPIRLASPRQTHKSLQSHQQRTSCTPNTHECTRTKDAHAERARDHNPQKPASSNAAPLCARRALALDEDQQLRAVICRHRYMLPDMMRHSIYMLSSICIHIFILYAVLAALDAGPSIYMMRYVPAWRHHSTATENIERSHIYLDTKCDKHIHVICHPCCHVYLAPGPKCWASICHWAIYALYTRHTIRNSRPPRAQYSARTSHT